MFGTRLDWCSCVRTGRRARACCSARACARRRRIGWFVGSVRPEAAVQYLTRVCGIRRRWLSGRSGATDVFQGVWDWNWRESAVAWSRLVRYAWWRVIRKEKNKGLGGGQVDIPV
ncbi:UNVERIFIED_CONTAM: hypothetical protein Sangu_2933300 [Sesamum angustifolium]|uniref:Uncharacterized protein n=1 Tax=Sesamum angustifolium TaxID=2727405 RepID=A0AAW2IKP9_9LAMI